ncbi:MAG: ATP-dependent DNA helicase [Lachnospiraceae bacterium]
MNERELIKISVRDLVEFILRGGDIDNRIGGRKDAESMLAGARIHRKIQKSMGSDYHAEVSLKQKVSLDAFDLQIEGRADGIIDTDPVTIDEIKGMYLNLDYLEQPVGVHLAQAKCYAYIYGIQNRKESMQIRMTYVNLDTEQIRYFEESYGMEELSQWFSELVKEYEKWAVFQYEWKLLRNESLKQVQFPYEYRKGQKELAQGVYRTILRKKKLFLQAPTGTGKTLSTLFPALKAMGEGISDRIFYLTAKTITRTAAVSCLNLLRDQRMRMKSVVITAKEKMCLCGEIECNPECCPYAKGHFDRVNDAVYELLQSDLDHMGREEFQAHAEKWMVCPFELSLDVSSWADTIICDYNYAFDPRAHLRRFFYEGVKQDYLFLIDEAHNLVDRARTMYSASVCKEEFLELRKELRGKAPKVEKQLGRCNTQLLELKRECESFQILKDVNVLVLNLLNLSGELQNFLEIAEQGDLKKKVMEFYLKLRTFLNTYELLDDSYKIYSRMCEDGRFCVHLFCVHPANRLREYLEYGRSTVFFSATLLPVQYYKELLGGGEEDYAIYADSSFPTEHRLVCIGTDVTSRYARRGRSEYEKIAEYIEKMVRVKEGNYLVFFPSYKMLKEISEIFMDREYAKGCRCLIQNTFMSEQDREVFLQEFEREEAGSLIGFCVMGGIFSEGIDLTEEKLIGAAVVGTGLPQVCTEREIVKQFFDEKEQDGFSYAYLYPGMNKVLQSAGRVIRTQSDRGCILLLDERFQREEYQRLFPREWKQPVFGSHDTIERILQDFWQNDYSVIPR